MRVTTVVVLACLAGAQLAAAAEPRQGLPWDWSHRHVIYNPETADEAIANGRYDQWLKNSADPRYLSQLIRKQDAQMDQQAAVNKAAVTKAGLHEKSPPYKPPNPWGGSSKVHRDWSNVMGGASGVGTKGTYPAKYAFDVNATPSCTGDYIVYTTGSAGAAGSGVLASTTGTFTSTTTAANNTVTITNGTQVLTLTSSTSTNSGLQFATVNLSATVRATNLVNAINRNGGTVGVTASSAAGVVTVTAITHGTGANLIALADTLSNFSWAKTTLKNGSGTAGQPTIFALNELYAQCGTATQGFPDTFWAYNTSTGATVALSPILSLDGTQVAFIEVSSGGTASLVLLRWSDTALVGTIGAPTTPNLASSAANYHTGSGCAAPCMFKFSLGANNSRSSPYYDYTGDSLWVGDDAGKLHRFTNVFKGTPAESGSPWPVTVTAGDMLSPPVYDQTTGLVYVGSERGDATTTGGRLHSVSATGTLVSSGELSGDPETGQPAGSTGVADAPILDTSAKRIYTFVASDPTTNCGGVQCQAIYQFHSDTSINGLTAPVVQVGRGQFYDRILYAGAFDNAYWSSNPSSPTGALYVCGTLADGTSSRRPTLWKIPITNNVMGAAVVGPALVNADSAECSPITEVANGTHDYFYVGVPAGGSAAGCTGSCLYMFDLAGATWSTSLNPVAGLAAAGGTSGIIIDNVSSSNGASQVYYSTLTSPGVAVQASQAGLN